MIKFISLFIVDAAIASTLVPVFGATAASAVFAGLFFGTLYVLKDF